MLKHRVIPALAVLLLLNSSCMWRQSEVARMDSFKAQAALQIDHKDIGSFLSSRVALLVQTSQFPTNAWAAGDLRLNVSRLGCAAAIDRRGYFLTAAHCIGDTPVYLIYYTFGAGGPHIRALSTRVVWRGSTGEPDLAVLHVRQVLARTFDWAEDVHKEQPVVAVGLAWTNKPNRDLRGFELMGGRILASTRRKGKHGHFKIANDVPLQPGDSGGPLVDSEAHLVGINVRATPPFAHWILPRRALPTITERPNREWLSDLIEEDARTNQWSGDVPMLR